MSENMVENFIYEKFLYMKTLRKFKDPRLDSWDEVCVSGLQYLAIPP